MTATDRPLPPQRCTTTMPTHQCRAGRPVDWADHRAVEIIGQVSPTAPPSGAEPGPWNPDNRPALRHHVVAVRTDDAPRAHDLPLPRRGRLPVPPRAHVRVAGQAKVQDGGPRWRRLVQPAPRLVGERHAADLAVFFQALSPGCSRNLRKATGLLAPRAGGGCGGAGCDGS